MITFLSLLPIFSLLVCLLVLKFPASKAGAISMLLALAISSFFFGIDIFGLTVAVSKGMSLALYVLLIIWGALFLYHLVDEFKAIEVINKNIVIFIQDRFIQFLLLAWLFSSVLQGIAGFGVPVVIVVPILISLGFDPIVSTAAVLLGHSWSVSFGSMGSSFFTIYLVTGIPQEYLGITMWIFDMIAMVLTGIAVCFLYGGFRHVLKGMTYILPTSIVMSLTLITTVKLQMFSLVSLNTALVGLAFLFIMYKIRSKTKLPRDLYADSLTLGQAVLPYAAIIALSLLFQFLDFGKIGVLSFKFPGFTTALGYVVNEETAYSKIKLFGHPAPIIVMAAAVGIFAYKSAKVWNVEKFMNAITKTVKKCVPTSISLVCLITMALIMMDSGMTNQLADSVANISGRLYPLFAPFFGVLGSFITGSNTNSNVIFGKFQYSVAQSLGISGAVMCGIQSIAGSIGVSIGPTTVLMGTSAAKLIGQESLVYKKVIGFTLFIALVFGIVNYILLELLNFSVGGV